VVWKADERLIAMIWSHFSAGNSSIGATCWMPALFTRMSTRPSASPSGDQRAAASPFDMSAGDVDRRTLCSSAIRRGERMVLVAVGERVQHHVRAQPRQFLGDPEPMPEFEPVMTAVLPDIDMCPRFARSVWRGPYMLRGTRENRRDGPRRAPGQKKDALTRRASSR
jgi:hypothetical protein